MLLEDCVRTSPAFVKMRGLAARVSEVYKKPPKNENAHARSKQTSKSDVLARTLKPFGVVNVDSATTTTTACIDQHVTACTKAQQGSSVVRVPTVQSHLSPGHSASKCMILAVSADKGDPVVVVAKSSDSEDKAVARLAAVAKAEEDCIVARRSLLVVKKKYHKLLWRRFLFLLETSHLEEPAGMYVRERRETRSVLFHCKKLESFKFKKYKLLLRADSSNAMGGIIRTRARHRKTVHRQMAAGGAATGNGPTK